MLRRREDTPGRVPDFGSTSKNSKFGYLLHFMTMEITYLELAETGPIMLQINKHLLVSFLRPCYTKQFFLQLATQQTLRCKLQDFSQHCETSCLRVTSPLQLATQFCQNGPIRAQDVGDLARPPSCLLLYALQVCEKSCKRVTPPLQLERLFIRHRCVASCKKNCLV